MPEAGAEQRLATPPQENRSGRPPRYTGELTAESKFTWGRAPIKVGPTGDVWFAKLHQPDGKTHDVVVKIARSARRTYQLSADERKLPPDEQQKLQEELHQQKLRDTQELNMLSDEALGVEVLNTDDPLHPRGPHSYGTIEYTTDKGTRLFFVEERINGRPLYDFLDGISLRDSMAIIKGVLTQLTILHKNGVVHRDIKPDNIMIRVDDPTLSLEDRVVLIDLGGVAIPKDLASQTQHSLDERYMITQGYYPPETVSPQGIELASSSDIFSVGVTIAQAFLGENPQFFFARHGVPFTKKDTLMFHAIKIRAYMQSGKYVRDMRLALRKRGIDEAHINWLLKSLQFKKENRYTDAQQMLDGIPTKETVQTMTAEAAEKATQTTASALLIEQALRKTRHNKEKIPVPLQVTVNDLPITIGYFPSRFFHRMEFGIRVGTDKRTVKSARKILQALGTDTRDAVAPTLYTIGLQNALHPSLIEQAAKIGAITKATQTDSNGILQDVIFLPDLYTGKMIAYYPQRTFLENLHAIADVLNKKSPRGENSDDALLKEVKNIQAVLAMPSVQRTLQGREQSSVAIVREHPVGGDSVITRNYTIL